MREDIKIINMDQGDKNQFLVISNNPFSQSDANGRTLGELFSEIDPKSITQFFINSKPIDMIDCQYIQVSDSQLIKSLFCFKKSKTIAVKKGTYCDIARKRGHKISNNPLFWLIRNTLWNIFLLKNRSQIKKWLATIRPSKIILQAGDCPFLNKLALLATKWSKARLIVFNTEDYCFKKWDYSSKKSIFTPLWPLVHIRLLSSMDKIMKTAKCCIYNSVPLLKLYEKRYPAQKASVFYTTTHWVWTPYQVSNKQIRLVYFGNLSGKRTNSLLEIAKIIKNQKLQIEFDVYGPPEKEKEKRMLQSFGIKMHDFVPYSSIYEIAKKSDILLHVESFDSFTIKDRINGFSTKIADCLASGRCFLIYAPSQMACFQYLQENKCAYTCGTKAELVTILSNLAVDKFSRSKYLENAKKIVMKNHLASVNSKRFRRILYENSLS